MIKLKKKPGRPKKYKGSEEERRMVVYVTDENKSWVEDQVKKNIFGGKSHAVNYCITIMRTVFEQREEQIMQLAKSSQMGSIVNNIDSIIKEGKDEQ